MAIEDWIDPYPPEDDDIPRTCDLCGRFPLYWEEVGGRYVLVDEESRVHAPHCSGRVAKAREFPKLEDNA